MWQMNYLPYGLKRFFEFPSYAWVMPAMVEKDSFRVLFPFVNGMLAISEWSVLSWNLSLSFSPCFCALYD
jgi:hypothetical protein